MPRASTTRWVSQVLLGVVLCCGVAACQPSSKSTGEPGSASPPKELELLNVSYDPTRELWAEINEKFRAEYKAKTGQDVKILPSHGGSSTQARQVVDGLEADVVTLALWPDTDSIRKAGLMAEGWESRFPDRSLPYYSTTVFVVRKGNPKNIKDWPDIVKPDVAIVTPNPKTSGGGKLNLLAAWGSVVRRGGTEEQAKEFLTKLYRQTPALDTGARAATVTFSQKKIGDVHLTWENEGHLEVKESNGELELVYPPISIKAEPHVAIVDENVKRKGTKEAAEAYLNFVYTPEGQVILGKNHYRPRDLDRLKRGEEFPAEYAAQLKQLGEQFPEIQFFTITDIAKGWDEAQERFFATDALFDTIMANR